MKAELSPKQKEVLGTLQKYPNHIVMHTGWLTGGHGIKLRMGTVMSLRRMGYVTADFRISEKGKSINL